LPLLVISGADVRANLSLSREAFVDFALLLGTDFTPRIRNVGPARALRFIRAHGSIENVVTAEGQRYPPRVPQEDYLAQVSRAREVFGTLPSVPENLEERVKDAREGKDEEKVDWLMRKAGLGRQIMEDTDYEQSLSGNYFGDNPSAL
jgi:flap endonuclease-1